MCDYECAYMTTYKWILWWHTNTFNKFILYFNQRRQAVDMEDVTINVCTDWPNPHYVKGHVHCDLTVKGRVLILEKTNFVVYTYLTINTHPTTGIGVMSLSVFKYMLHFHLQYFLTHALFPCDSKYCELIMVTCVEEYNARFLIIVTSHPYS